MGKYPAFKVKSGEEVTGIAKLDTESTIPNSNQKRNRGRKVSSTYFRPYFCLKRQDGIEGFFLFSPRNRFFRKQINYPLSLKYLSEQFNKAQFDIMDKWGEKYQNKFISHDDCIIAMRKEIMKFHKNLNKSIELYLDMNLAEVYND